MNAPQGPRIGSLCSGYEGLGAAIQAVLGGDLVFVADPDPGAARILAHHHPDVPNLGDITQVNWEEVPRVNVLAAGFPCQDLSVAGRGAGIADGTRSGLWLHIVRAIKILRPQLVVIENVPGIRTRPAHSDVEPCPWCVGNSRTEPVLRALGAVLGGLADLGFDAEWVSVPASAVGAPHRRERVFVLAWPADAPRPRLEAWRQGRPGGTPAPEDSDVAAGGERRVAAPRQAQGRRARANARGRGGAPAAEAACPTCGHPESHHDDGGYCAGCGTCTDPELGRPNGDHGATAPTHAESLRRGEGGGRTSAARKAT